MKNILRMIGMILVSILGIAVGFTTAADYPSKPITAIAPASPGGGTDTTGRAFAAVAEKFLGQPVMVVNRPASAGIIGTIEIANAEPDGYTIGIIGSARTATMAEAIASGKKPPFTRDQFIPIASYTLESGVIIVPYNSPWKTLADLVKDCKAKPDHYAFASGGMYTTGHLFAELFCDAAGIKARHVPYKGGGEVLPAVVGGHVDFASQFASTCTSLQEGKKLRMLAVQSHNRLKFASEVPTCEELGVVGAELSQFIGIMVPKKTPIPIVEKLKEVARKVSEDKRTIQILEDTGAEIYYMDSDQLTKYWANEEETFTKIYKKLKSQEK